MLIWQVLFFSINLIYCKYIAISFHQKGLLSSNQLFTHFTDVIYTNIAHLTFLLINSYQLSLCLILSVLQFLFIRKDNLGLLNSKQLFTQSFILGKRNARNCDAGLREMGRWRQGECWSFVVCKYWNIGVIGPCQDFAKILLL